MERLSIQLDVDPASIADPDAHPAIVAELGRMATELLAGKMAERLLQTTADEHGLTVADLKGRSRTAPVAAARQAAMAALMDAGLSSVQVGRLLGRDHTTVLAGVERHRRREAEAAAAGKVCDDPACERVAMGGGRWCLPHFQQVARPVRRGCGTEAGAKAHRRRGEQPCQACREGAAQAKTLRKAGAA